jgi:hypothetical protein
VNQGSTVKKNKKTRQRQEKSLAKIHGVKTHYVEAPDAAQHAEVLKFVIVYAGEAPRDFWKNVVSTAGMDGKDTRLAIPRGTLEQLTPYLDADKGFFEVQSGPTKGQVGVVTMAESSGSSSSSMSVSGGTLTSGYSASGDDALARLEVDLTCLQYFDLIGMTVVFIQSGWLGRITTRTLRLVVKGRLSGDALLDAINEAGKTEQGKSLEDFSGCAICLGKGPKGNEKIISSYKVVPLLKYLVKKEYLGRSFQLGMKELAEMGWAVSDTIGLANPFYTNLLVNTTQQTIKPYNGSLENVNPSVEGNEKEREKVVDAHRVTAPRNELTEDVLRSSFEKVNLDKDIFNVNAPSSSSSSSSLPPLPPSPPLPPLPPLPSSSSSSSSSSSLPPFPSSTSSSSNYVDTMATFLQLDSYNTIPLDHEEANV